jgi:hypothetical protein
VAPSELWGHRKTVLLPKAAERGSGDEQPGDELGDLDILGAHPRGAAPLAIAVGPVVNVYYWVRSRGRGYISQQSAQFWINEAGMNYAISLPLPNPTHFPRPLSARICSPSTQE